MNKKAELDNKALSLIDSLAQFERENGAEGNSILRGMLSDIMHYAYKNKMNFEKAVEGAKMVWQEDLFTKFSPGMEVDVVEPQDKNACWSRCFRGVVKKVSHDRKMYDHGDVYSVYALVEDQDGNGYDIDLHYLYPVEED